MLKTVTWMPGMTLDEVKKQILVACLDFCNGNKEATASSLGIHRNTLDAQLKAYEREGEARRVGDEKRQEETKRILLSLAGGETTKDAQGATVFAPAPPFEHDDKIIKPYVEPSRAEREALAREAEKKTPPPAPRSLSTVPLSPVQAGKTLAKKKANVRAR